MKIQEAIEKNKIYWEKILDDRIKRIQKLEEETLKLRNEGVEAQTQINLYTKAAEILSTLDQEQVNDVKVEVENGN